MITLKNEFVSFGASAFALSCALDSSTLLLVDALMSTRHTKSGCSSGASKPVGPAEQYLDAMLQIVERIDENLSTITDVAEIVADRVLAGGALSAKDKEDAFALEAITRAGGLILLGKGAEAGVVGQNTVLLGSSGGDRDYDIQQVEAARNNDALVVAFVSHQQEPVKGYEPFEELPLLHEVADYSIDNFLKDNDAIVSIEGIVALAASCQWQYEGKICPAALVVNALNLWVFTAEFVAACVKGKCPRCI